jgi:SAM-dependent methyltransferase
MLRRAQRKCAGREGVTFLRADLSRPLPFPDASFDRVVVNNVLYALPFREATLAEAARVLRPGGLLVVSDPKAGAKMSELVRAHFREIAAMPPLRRAVAFVESCVTLPFMGLPPILLITSAVATKRRAGEYRFSTEDELKLLLSPFADVRISEAYAGQNWLAVAQAPAPSEMRTASSATSSLSWLPANDSTSS